MLSTENPVALNFSGKLLRGQVLVLSAQGASQQLPHGVIVDKRMTQVPLKRAPHPDEVLGVPGSIKSHFSSYRVKLLLRQEFPHLFYRCFNINAINCQFVVPITVLY